MADSLFFTGLATLLAISVGILLLIDFKQSQPYLDEIFHIPQAQQYCEYKFSEWDPKITTLPGLYLVSLAILRVAAFFSSTELIDVCSVLWLRFTNVFFVIGNAWLLREVLIQLNLQNSRKSFPNKDKKENTYTEDVLKTKSTITALVLSTFPVLYFFTFLYYTDSGSTCFVLLMYLMSLKQSHVAAALSGIAAIMFRQTNVIWVVFSAGTVALKKLEQYRELKNQKSQSLPREIILYVQLFFKHCISMCFVLWTYGLVVLGFGGFIIANKGIVVGDRSSHEACLNFPQLFYFLAFTLFFSIPLLILPSNIIDFLNFLKTLVQRPLKLLKCILVLFCMAFLVYHFTYVHKYLLADNRHYPFYVWRKFYARHWLARYLAIPVYAYTGFSLTAILSKKQQSIWQLLFWICVTLATVPQKLFEFRYFIIPYIFCRIHSPLASYISIVLEFVLYFAINFITVYLFIEKPFVWENEPNQVQRFMW
ncbi:putative Dol-P-Glc:Glc(2)Man(9)GlcNAc(2)-PP-Dol alpha-1,2-glucosyltransferase isoform X2 [Nematostella vectensis]|uniref:putative Dol-P-Glc:Glc(2)Man(9)GlcNAc(2)-PP-Dol alpha-1,2-glucosyltransferase isoform X2 n=1 Tax=Nematostella vectensis TaxID=45351 RepID=UPI0020770930|nr:putative Dol-P-Glc:Glc(2)Man(9)GlcNAc(2)-PP-Dol alpha-1,2-glucosyltransferase isoform X2 [Nematostella vectensis]